MWCRMNKRILKIQKDKKKNDLSPVAKRSETRQTLLEKKKAGWSVNELTEKRQLKEVESKKD